MLTAALIWFYFRDFANYMLDWAEHTHKKRMAKSEVQRCLDWIFQQQGELEGCTFGQGHDGVQEAVRKQKLKDLEIKQFEAELKKILEKPDIDDGSSLELKGQYDSVKALSSKRGSCLEVISQISSLQNMIEDMSTEFDSRVVHLVNIGEVKKQKGAQDQTNESLARTAQNCISSVRKNWKWILTVMQCSEVHLKNAAAYQEFFHEVEEAEYWMNTTLSRIHLSFDRKKLAGDRADARAIQDEIRDVLMAYLQWQTKVDNLFERSKGIVPVPQRLRAIKEPRPVIALADYKTNEIEFMEGDTLTLLDNSDKKKWRVQNGRGQSGVVPAVIIVIPAPTGEALDAVIKLRIQLLSLWTTSVKRLGYQMIAFMLLVFRDWNEDETQILQCMKGEDKRELLRILKFLEETLVKNWNGYHDYQELEERILRLKMILEEAPEGKSSDDALLTTVVVQIKMLEELLRRYGDFWAYWETFRVIVELLRQPKYLLVCDKWEQLRFITTAHFVRFWDTHLELDNIKPVEAKTLALYETPKESMPVKSDVTVCTEKEETTSEEVETTVEEECHTFVIKGVIDPRNKQELTLQNAIMMGIIDQARGAYVNPRTGKAISMNQAMSEGMIIMEVVSKQKIREEKKSFGLITIKTTKETRPYTITSVLHPKTDEKLSVGKAVDLGILNTNEGTYILENGDSMPIADAIASGLVLVEYGASDANGVPEVVTKTYAVNGVVDQKKRDKVSFHDAINSGILDKETAEYFHNVTGEKYPVHEAIMKGFIKARVVIDPKKIDIDPENKIIVQKFESAKSKILKSMKAMKAMKAAGKPAP